MATNYRIYIALISTLLLTSCAEVSWDALAKEAAHECGNEKKCMIKLSGVYSFNWFAAYIFDRGASRDVIEEIVGDKISNYREFCQGIIFLDEAGKVVSSVFSSCTSDFQIFQSKSSAVAEFLIHKEQKLYFRLSRPESFLCASRDDTIYVGRQYYGLTPCSTTQPESAR